MPRSRIPGSGAFVDRARRHGLGSCRGVWFATVCTHLTPVFQGGSCEGEEADSASIRGHLVSSQFPWEVKFASVMSAPPFLGTSASAASKTATGNSSPRSRRLRSHSQGARNEGRRNRSSALGKAFRSGGTESSNPASSSGESCANLTFADESAHVASSSRRSSSGETQEVKASADVLDASRLTLNLGCS